MPCWVTTMQPDGAAADFYGAAVRLGVRGRRRVPDRRLAAATSRRSPRSPPATRRPIRPGSPRSGSRRREAAAERGERAGGRVIAGPSSSRSGACRHRRSRPARCSPSGSAGSHGAQLVNEPGAWAMSRLDTPDLEGAEGVLRRRCSGGRRRTSTWATMFRLPGYVGGEPQQPVSREVVAVMVPERERRALERRLLGRRRRRGGRAHRARRGAVAGRSNARRAHRRAGRSCGRDLHRHEDRRHVAPSL